MEDNLTNLEEVTGVEESEAAETTQDESTEATEAKTDVDTGAVEPEQQSAEENARYAAIRRRAEEEARRKYESEMATYNQQITAMCQDITHPVTGQPITNVRDYMDALQIQQRQASERELQEKGVDPSIINRMIESNPIVMQAQQVIEQNKMSQAEQALQNDLAAITQYDPNIKGVNDLAALPNFPEILERVNRGASLLDAYKMVNFDNFMKHQSEAGRQQAINQMRGKEHLPSQSTGVAQSDDYVEVPAEIMSRMKSEGKTEKQIRDLYKSVASKLHLN